MAFNEQKSILKCDTCHRLELHFPRGPAWCKYCSKPLNASHVVTPPTKPDGSYYEVTDMQLADDAIVLHNDLLQQYLFQQQALRDILGTINSMVDEHKRFFPQAQFLSKSLEYKK